MLYYLCTFQPGDEVLKINDEPRLTPLENELKRASDFARNLAACGALQTLLERLEDAETALHLAETDKEYYEENKEILPEIKKDIEDIELLLIEFATSEVMFNLTGGITA